MHLRDTLLIALLLALFTVASGRLRPGPAEQQQPPPVLSGEVEAYCLIQDGPRAYLDAVPCGNPTKDPLAAARLRERAAELRRQGHHHVSQVLVTRLSEERR